MWLVYSVMVSLHLEKRPEFEGFLQTTQIHLVFKNPECIQALSAVSTAYIYVFSVWVSCTSVKELELCNCKGSQ